MITKESMNKQGLYLVKTPIFIVFILIYTLSYYYNFNNAITVFTQTILVFIIVYFEYKKTDRIVSPLIFWLTCWLLPTIIARVDLHVYDFGAVWGTQLLYYVVVNSCTFYFAYNISYYLTRYTKSFRRLNEKTVEFNYNKLCRISVIIFIISNLAYICNVLYLRNIPQLSSNVDVLRRDFVITPFFSIVNICRFAFAFVPIIIKKTSDKKYIKQLKIQSGISLLFNFLTGWRGYVFQILIFMITSQLLINSKNSKIEKRKEMRIIFRYTVLAVLLIGVIAVTRANSNSQTLTSQKYVYYTFEQIYLYITPNFYNFQQALTSIVPNNNFLYTSEFLWGIFINSNHMPGYVPLSFSIGSFNVSTYLLYPYADFGLFGTVIWTCIIGVYSAIAFKKVQTGNSLFYFTGLGICNITIFNMHNGFFLRSSSVIIWMIATWAINRSCKKKYKNVISAVE